MDFEEILNNWMPALFVAEIRVHPDKVVAKSRLGSLVMDVLEEKVGKEKTDEYRKFIDKQLDKHDIDGLLNDIIDEFNRLNGAKNTVKVNMEELRRQLDEDE